MYQAGITVTLPKPMTSGAKSEGRFGKAGLRLHRKGGLLSLPSRREAQILLHQRGKWVGARPLLDDRLPCLPDQKPLHDKQRALVESAAAFGIAQVTMSPAGAILRVAGYETTTAGL